MGLEAGAIAAIVGASIGGAGTIASVAQGREAAKEQESAMRRAKLDAKKQQELAEREFNRANAKMPDIASLRKANAGASSTLLTSPSAGAGNMTLGGGKTLLGG